MNMNMNMSFTYPGSGDVIEHTVVSDRGSLVFRGQLLGKTSSHYHEHLDHAGDFARKGERCYACRWSEYRIYLVHDYISATSDLKDHLPTGRYVVVSYGHSIVPEESTFRRVIDTDSPSEVIELLTTRKHNQPPMITSSAARLLARASDLDAGIQEAWDNRVIQ